MNLSFFTSLFYKNKNKPLKLPDSLLIKKLKSVADKNNFPIFENITIYHHSKNFFIPLLISDESRGIFLFEYKDWSYNELKNAKIEKATLQDSKKDNLAFEKSHEFIKQKFNELIHNDGVPIFNYLLMENLNTDEYKHLDESFQKLLPEEKVMFNDSSEDTILIKILKSKISKIKLPNTSEIMSTLLIQYAIVENSETLHLSSKEQREFIDSPLLKYTTLKALNGSGKTSSILLKAILEKLKKTDLKIIIIKPTTLACDILKKKLLNSIEHAIIEFDMTSIEIITPIELVNRHLFKLNYAPLKNELEIDTALMKKRFHVADLIICDDSELYFTQFIEYIKHVQNKNHLIIVETSNSKNEELIFTKNFKNPQKETIFYQANTHAKALQTISSLLKTDKAKDILVVCSKISQKRLADDLEFFIEDKTLLLDSSKNLIDQDLNSLMLSSYDDINSLNVKFVILMNICYADVDELSYAYNLAKKKVYVLYEDECENLALIRNNFENHQE
ncbi:MAG: hypothetical protein K8R44_04885 [Sulfurimonas sp.]|nr:hypothetical protein [Sulfurimonas sp.]